jgi:hypothetical protein
MSKQPKSDEPEIKPVTPDGKQTPVEPEIPPDKDAPQKLGPTKAGAPPSGGVNGRHTRFRSANAIRFALLATPL